MDELDDSDDVVGAPIVDSPEVVPDVEFGVLDSVSVASSPPFRVPDGAEVTLIGAPVAGATGVVNVVVVTGAVVGTVVTVDDDVVEGVVVEVVVEESCAKALAPATPTTVDAATAEVHTAKWPRRVDIRRRPI